MRRNLTYLIPAGILLTMLVVIAVVMVSHAPRATEPAPATSSPAGTASAAASAPATPASQIPTGLPYPLATVMATGVPYPAPSEFPTASEIPATAYPAPQTLVPQATATLATVTQTSTGVSPNITASPTVTPAPTLTDTQAGPTMVVSPPYPAPQDTDTPGAYPPPLDTDTPGPYPAPSDTDTPESYPGPGTSTPRTSIPPNKTLTITPTPPPGTGAPGTQFPTPTYGPGTGTPRATPTELPLRPRLSPPPPGSAVTIWHSWGPAETEVLLTVIQSFKKLYPQVTFTLTYVPRDDLLQTYQAAAYYGAGPSLLLAPAEWGPALYDAGMLSDLAPFVPDDYLKDINRPALASGRYGNALISLPLAQTGMLMYRNSSLLSLAPGSMDALVKASREVTHGGVVGSYLERGASYSSADILGLGGELMDANGTPAFNSADGAEWLKLLGAYDSAGAVTLNTNRDLEMFKRGKVGLILDGSWNLADLSQALGANLAIDPWPTYGGGHLSGWVHSESVYLNANANGGDQYASLSFMGYLLEPQVQLRFAEVGHIPSVNTTQPRDVLIQQAMAAFQDGTAYPITVEPAVLSIYWTELDKALRAVFDQGISPRLALQTASTNIVNKLNILRMEP